MIQQVVDKEREEDIEDEIIESEFREFEKFIKYIKKEKKH